MATARFALESGWFIGQGVGLDQASRESPMGKHELKICPRCGSSFECKSNRVELCGCLSVALTSEALEYLSERYQDCLCVACLAEVNRLCSENPKAEDDDSLRA
jgi:hypothetical protein